LVGGGSSPRSVLVRWSVGDGGGSWRDGTRPSQHDCPGTTVHEQEQGTAGALRGGSAHPGCEFLEAEGTEGRPLTDDGPMLLRLDPPKAGRERGPLGPFHHVRAVISSPVGVLVGGFSSPRSSGGAAGAYPADGIYDSAFWVGIWGVWRPALPRRLRYQLSRDDHAPSVYQIWRAAGWLYSIWGAVRLDRRARFA